MAGSQIVVQAESHVTETEKGDFIPTLGGTFTTHVLTGITGHGWVPVPPRADRFEIRDETLSVPLLFTSISEVTPVPG